MKNLNNNEGFVIVDSLSLIAAILITLIMLIGYKSYQTNKKSKLINYQRNIKNTEITNLYNNNIS